MALVEEEPRPYKDYDTDNLIGMFVRMRDAIKDADEKHKKKTAPAREELSKLESEFLLRLNEMKVDSIKHTVHGTVYRTHRKSATLADPAAFKGYVINSQQWELADWRANATAVADFLESHAGVCPPGVNYTVHYTVGVRRGKGDDASS